MATSAEELTNCVICTEFFTDPQVLPCDHVFCKGCVNQMKDAGTIKCRNCSKVCVIEDVKPDFRLATFLDAFAKYAENVTKQPSTGSHDVTENHVTPPAGDKCESCEESVIDSFCHQCQQWFCKSCKKMHGKVKSTKDHTYTPLAEKSQELKIDISKYVKLFKQETEKLKISAKCYESAINELKETQKKVAHKSKVLRKAFHEDIDKYFDAVDGRIESVCNPYFNSFANSNQDMNIKMKACVDLTAKMDHLMAQNDSELFARGEQLLNKAEELSQSLAGSSMDAVEIPQVRLERRQDWSLEGAVDLQLLPVQRRLHVSITLFRAITV